MSKIEDALGSNTKKKGKDICACERGKKATSIKGKGRGHPERSSLQVGGAEKKGEKKEFNLLKLLKEKEKLRRQSANHQT